MKNCAKSISTQIVGENWDDRCLSSILLCIAHTLEWGFRLCFFLETNEKGEWKNHFFKGTKSFVIFLRLPLLTLTRINIGIYERDRPHPLDPTRLPLFDRSKLDTFPEGYRHLGYCQEEIAGYKVKRDLPGSRGIVFSFDVPSTKRQK